MDDAMEKSARVIRRMIANEAAKKDMVVKNQVEKGNGKSDV